VATCVARLIRTGQTGCPSPGPSRVSYNRLTSGIWTRADVACGTYMVCEGYLVAQKLTLPLVRLSWLVFEGDGCYLLQRAGKETQRRCMLSCTVSTV